ncbi:SDR family NAD(P)-dependent oxidoreductase [Streptomyces sp. DASNCL29]|uniref:SDR family NAD(P)-dependent oxidoreductase n=1 Tax=Streptomyces sp. DASNCL29 TaxID=2583819 RepID=UPI00110FBBB4|nr:SDR family NAD(P)-dependent oxidoreductase [Streptomyces sp. DASNCL29]TMU98191.1 SDR family NAD(P)-dependent oxidoreductase [Streptomyces sp. DASNCL29]
MNPDERPQDTADDAVAIIGLALRLPGTDTLREFSRHLAEGRSLISEVAPERWSKERWFGSPRRGAQKTNSVWGGFIEQADCFDAAFFSISPHEAESMDPQQRFALELAWHAIEDAGLRARELAGTRTGVFMGVCHADYAELMERDGAKTDGYFPTGTAYSIISNRVSYYFDLQGPSITNDTACSSSLVSVYEAVTALRNGDCTLALAGGVNLCWSPKHFVAFSQASMLSPTGRCRAFDKGADGYVRGEGGAVLLLKPLAQAVADGDPVHAVIRGAATNHGGRTSSLTVTNPAAQANLVEGLYTRAGIRPETVSYIEAHGPGTPVGDPIEVIALKRAFRTLHEAQGTEPEPESVGIGSVKTNIGHLEGAAGVAGIAKVVAALADRVLPATVGFEEQNKLIDLDGSPFRIVRDTQPWDAPAPRRAGVSSFGFGGTNAHVVLEEYVPDERLDTDADDTEGPYLVPLSTRTPERLREAARRLHTFLTDEPVPLRDLAHTLQTGREPMAARVAFVTADRRKLLDALAEFADGMRPDATAHSLDDGDSGALATATRWAEGDDVDWAALPGHADVRRVRLPTYPFARDRHWFRTRAEEQATPAPHPLVPRNASTLDEHRYTAVFTGDEPFLDAHRVHGTRVLPAAAQLELARAAVSYATRRDDAADTTVRLHDTAWLRPLVVDGQPVEAHVVITPQGDGTLGYEIRTGTVVHSRGTASVGTHDAPESLDLTALRASCATPRDPAEAYAALRAAGLEYGPAMRGITEIRLGEGELLARLERAAADVADTAVALPPSVLDAALQASVLLQAALVPEAGGSLSLPFALDRLDLHAPCADVMWARVRHQGGKGLDTFDIDLCDDTGSVRARLSGLAQRTVAEVEDSGGARVAPAGPGTGTADAPRAVPAETTDPSRVVAAGSRWVAAPAAPSADPVTVHGFLTGRPDTFAAELSAATGSTFTVLPAVTPDAVADGAGTVLGLVLDRVRDVLQSKLKGAHRFLVLVDDQVPRRFHAPLTGLFRTLNLENPSVSGRVVRVAGLGTAPAGRVADLVRQEAADPAAYDAEIRHTADGTRHAWRPVELELNPGPQAPPLKSGGVYWLTGGLGGIGRSVARYFARHAGVTVVLSGRTDAGDGTGEALEELRAAGVDAHYLTADVGSAPDVERAVQGIVREHGSLDGIVHAAGTLRDGYLLTKDPRHVTEVLRPKVSGVLHLDAATRGLALDFFVVFSSVAGVYGNAGQGDYAAANAFLDAFAHDRQTLVDAGERTGRTVAVSWPLWADGGMTVDDVTRASMRRQRGWEPLPTEDGLRVLGAALRDTPEHIVVAYGAEASLALAPRDEPAPRPAVPAPAAGAFTEAALVARTTQLLKDILGEVLHHDPATLKPTVGLIEYGIDSIGVLEATERLEEIFGPLPKTLFFEHVDIEGVVGYLIEEHRATLETRFGDDAEPEPEPTATEPVVVPVVQDAPVVTTAPAAPPPTPPAPDDYHDIAIVGVSGRYPGADTLDELWTILEEGRHLFQEVPRDRWDHDAIHSPERSVPGKSAIRTGTFLKEIDTFDPRYFRISKRDAERMSPEVRLFLQVGVEALEDAGYSRETIHRSYDGDVGVLVGTMSNHYGLYGFQNSLTRGAPATGSYMAAIPNTLSYFYGFTGPSIFLDTMCSGSSTCVHQAVQMLRARECKMVVAGGVNLLLHPYNLVTSSHEHFTTATSDVIRSFGLGADGTTLGEGVGAVVLKPLVEAEREGDHVYAVIKGTALSNAGVRNGFTVPNPRMQARAIEKAIDDSGVDPRTITYVEGHGSGTSLGDPIEVRALTSAFGKYTPDKQFCALGSVKSNMGHLLHAAGMIGFAKVILQLQKRTLVPSLHSEELNPDIAFEDTPFRVQHELAAWKPAVTSRDGVKTVHPRRAGITSIGAGGMNSHIVVEEYVAGPGPHAGGPRGAELFIFSAMTDTALETSLARFRHYLAAADEADLPSIAHTLRLGKNELPRRWAFLAKDLAGAVEAVDRYLAGDRDQAAALASTDPGTATARDLAVDWAGGGSVDWTPLTGEHPPRRISLPAYPFERVRCWVEPEPGAPGVTAPLALREKAHPFLGANHSDVDGLRYVLDVHLDDLADYGCVQDKVRGIVPTFAVDLALAVGKVSGFTDSPRVRGLRLYGPVPWADTARLVTTFTPVDRDTASAVVFREDEVGARTPVAEFNVHPGDGRAAPEALPVRERDVTRVLDREDVLAKLAEGGIAPEPLRCGVTGASWLPDGKLVLTVEIPQLRQDHTAKNVRIAPHVLAAIAHAVQLAAERAGEPDWARQIPCRFDDVRVFEDARAADDVAYVVLDAGAHRVRLVDGEGRALAELTGMRWGDGDTGPPNTDMERRGTPVQAPHTRTEPSPLPPPPRQTDADTLVAFAVDELRGLAADILKFDADDLDAHTGFDAFGFDSISLVAFSKLIKESLGIELTPAVFFDVNTLAALGRHLVAKSEERVRTARDGAAPRPVETTRRPRTREETPPAPAKSDGATRIAVIGVAGRFPQAPDLDTYWSNLAEGRDCVTDFPVHRYDAAYARVVEEADFPRHAGIVDDAETFDAEFFRIYPREAELMDPQHRLALETVWSAVEDSGYAPGALPRNTGMFFGVSGTDYATLLTTYGIEPDAFTSTGNAHSMLVNRISYVLDIRGPSQPVDTACSSSLVAVHRAMEAIRSGACDLAIAGGVNLLLSVDTFVSAHRAGMLSPTGRCRTFARDADGYVRGEGVGALVLKPLDAAERDGDAILGVLVGSAENHGGRANSLTAPNADAQADLVGAAMSGVDPDTVDYIETHGTGTVLGDPVEVHALRTAFRRLGAGPDADVRLGSVKTNIGHLEAAAGAAGLMKVLLALKHDVIPASLHSGELNPYLELGKGPFRVVRENEPWPRRAGHVPRRAGISSFGFGGANCHVVVEEYVADSARDTDAADTPVAVPLSARTPERLRQVARDLLTHLERTGDLSLPSLAWTLQTGREAMRERVGWVVGSHHELVAALRAFTEDGAVAGHGVRGTVTRSADDTALVVADGVPARLLGRWADGDAVDWRVLYGASTPQRVHLPTYPFAREPYWIPGAGPERVGEAGGAVAGTALGRLDRSRAALRPAVGAVQDGARDVLRPATGTALLVPRWAPKPVPALDAVGEGTPLRRVVILCGAFAGAREFVEVGVRCFTVESGRQRLDSRFIDVSRQVFELVRDVVAEVSADRTLVQVVAPVGGDDAVHLALAGLLRTAAAEDPSLTAQLVCLDLSRHQAPDGETVAALVAENARAAEDDLVLYRGGVRSVLTWRHTTVSAGDASVPWRDGGVYLITGGAGGIGAVVARAIARDVARPTLVLTGRSPRDARIDALLHELRAAGAVARYARADISRWEEVRHLVQDIREQDTDLHGIIHCAGVVRDAALVSKTEQEWTDVLAPKADGLVQLDRAVGDAPLDFLLLCSSGSAITGNPGQADYATANGFLDAFALLRGARVAAGERSGRTLSIAWPLWREGGMHVDESVRARLWQSRGLAPMESADGIEALAQAWGLGDEGHVWIHHGDLTRVPASPEGLAPDRAVDEALGRLTEIFAQVTKVPSGTVDGDASLHAMGLDSIMIVQLNRELALSYGEVSKTVFYEFPTLRALAEHLASKHEPQDAAPSAGEPSGQTPASAGRTSAPRPQSAPRPPRPASPGKREPIAVIGMTGRYPGAADLTEFWDDLRSGRDRIREVPADRWPLEGFYEPARTTAIATGRSYSKWGGFLDDFAAFDPLFFRIAPRDAYAMDPQERLFLQAAWEVLEDAGYTPEELGARHGHRVGVFAGVTKSGHARYGARRLPSGETVVPALSFASLSARTSHVLDLRGPSLTVDTMCSASLTAIHEACEHLYQGSCEAAIAGGVNLYLHPLDYVELCRSNMLSTDGRLRSFGSGGDGFVPGEGVGAVLLKPFSRALADGDQVLAVIRGTSVNHGGRTHGYTVPNPVAQAELIRDALDRAGVSARDIGYVEAHGTGTELGDPIEVTGLTLAFGQDTDDRQFCALGSAKSSIGHLEAAAGVAGLTKAVLQLRHRQFVPSLHAEELNPNLDLENTPFFVQREPADWPGDGPRLASVSSFGAGGSNAHVILEEHVPESASGRAPARAAAEQLTAAEQLVVLSARTPEQLRDQAVRLADHLDGAGVGVDLADLAFTLQTGRVAFDERLAVVATSVPGLREALSTYLNGDTAAPGLYRGTVGRSPGAIAEPTEYEDLRNLLATRWTETGKLSKLAALWTEGATLDWPALHGSTSPRRISLPTYPFARDRYWAGDLEAADTPAAASVVPPAGDASGAADTAWPLHSAPAPRAASTEPGVEPAAWSPPSLDERVCGVVHAKLAAALAMDVREIESRRAFAEYGLDSILGVRFVHELNEALRLDLTTSVIYDHSSADRLVTHLLDAHRETIALPVATTPEPAPALPAPVAGTPEPETTLPSPVVVVPDLTAANPCPGIAARGPIAVVGMSGRFAGSESLDELWQHLAEGHDLTSEATRWPLAPVDEAGRPRCTRGGFLDRVDEFDPVFFNVSGVEAAVMDPQQRLLLEESWKAFEDAGYAGRAINQRDCGVYVGCWEGDYRTLVGEDAPAQAFWGNLASVVPGRIAYFLDLKGPAIAVDTSCSSSLVALDLACKDLWSGETDMALAGGVYVQSTPRLFDLAGRAGMLSPTGSCRAFDHCADGFVPGEGVGVLVLKRLEDALADGDQVHGVIRASGTNHDGATNGITAPSSVSQERLLSEVYERFGVDVETIQVVEAHGTGTKLGDPIEFQALTRAFRKDTDKTGYCALGSVKTNLGHTQYAAGVAGIFKVLLGMKHEQIPASLHFERHNEAVQLDGSPFYLSTGTHPWPAPASGPRRGVVSSFGASGTNAHVVLEEPPARTALRTPAPAHLVVLSARSKKQLAQQVARLAAHCRQETALDCGDIAWTLAVGRAHFTHRFACVVRNREDLVQVLEQGLGGPRALTGEAKASPALATIPTDLTTLAGLFVRGTELDFERLLPGTSQGLRRVSLPTYPFARESHWATGTPPAPSARVAPATAPVAPVPPAPVSGALVHVAQSAFTPAHPLLTELLPVPGTPGALKGTVRLTGEERLLRDHLVRGARVLPGVVHLELAREAAVHVLGTDPAAGLRMRNVTWVRPLAVDGPLDVEVVVRPDGDTVAFTIGPPASDAGSYTEGRVLASTDAPPAPVDLTALRAACPAPVPGTRIAEALVAAGITHGPSLRAIDEAYVGEGTVVARLVAPSGEPSPYVLHPALTDSAIQASAALALDGPGGEVMVPFALDTLELFGLCEETMWAVVRVADPQRAAGALGRLDIDLVDERGAVRVRMTGYTSRAVPESAPSLFTPTWEPVSDEWGPASGQDRVLVVGASDEQFAEITRHFPRAWAWCLAPSASVEENAAVLAATGEIDYLLWIAPDTAPHVTDAAGFVAAQEDGVIAAFRMVKALLRTGADARSLRVTLVTRSALATYADEATRPAHAALHGLFGSLEREYGHWNVRRVDLDETAELVDIPAHTPGGTWARRSGQWLRRRLVPTAAAHPETAPYREGGVYVVIGGAGGLGEAWTRHVTQNHGASVVWLGRRPQDASIEARLHAARGRGEVRYLSADTTDPQALRTAYDEIRARYGQVHGVVHSALVLSDRGLANMAETDFRATLAAKVDTSVTTAQVFAGEQLDFILFFSSLQSFVTAAGQSNYAAGCAFADAYAHLLGRHLDCPVRVMNWGWWGSVGSVASAFHQQSMARWGLTSIEPPEAMAALDTLLVGPQPQVSYVKLTDPKAIEPIDPTLRTTVYPRASVRVAPEAVAAGARRAGVDERLLRGVADWRRTERDPLLAQLIRGHLEALGVGRAGELAQSGDLAQSGGLAGLRARGGIHERYTAWLAHALRVMPPHAPPLAVLQKQWAEKCARWSADPDKAAELALVDATLTALPDILTGRTPATDVMFPRGSVELVEGCYRNNRVADTFNHTMAAAASGIVAELLCQDPGTRIRILEIGAGTGGTSVGMFAALRPYQHSIETYTYTDLSKAFLNRAQARYGPDAPYLDCRRFDVEQPLAPQGIEVGSYQLVIAANVLHATRDMRNTLRNAKAAMRDRGWLLLNELTSFDVFSHLTFGLLEGWWLSEDVPLRVPGSPALSPEAWRDVLHGEGFPSVVSLLPSARDLGQQIIAAEADGIARQRTPAPARASAATPVRPAATQRQGATTTPASPTLPPAAPIQAVLAQTVPALAAPAPSETRAAVLAAYLTDKAADTLRIPAEKIEPETSFTAYGMDSILVLQFTNELRQDLGELSSTLLFDEDSVAKLGAYLLENRAGEVDAMVATLRPESAREEEPARDEGAVGVVDPVLGTLFHAAVRSVPPAQGSALLKAAARLRPAFAAGAEAGEPETLHLAEGAHEVGLVCLPSLIAPTGAHQYLRLAMTLRGQRSVWTTGMPGYGTGEALPQSLDAAVDVQVTALRRRFAGRPFALVAYSSGGWPAHEIVRRLEADGTPPAALVLLDSPARAGETLAFDMITITRWLTDRYPQLPADDEQLTAMARYAELFDGWAPCPVSAPTLFVAPASPEALSEVLGDSSRPQRRPHWPLEHTRLEVPGNHFTLLEEHAESTALAVHEWLYRQFG